MRVFQDAQLDLCLHHPELHGESLRVLLYLQAVAAWRNVVPGPTQVAKAMGLMQPNVSRAYRELREAKFLAKRDGTNYLSPLLCWKGSEHDLEEALSFVGEGLFAPSPPELTAPHPT